MKKPYKCRVEYLQSSGTQYIDTGLKGKNNIDFDYKCIFTNLDGTAQCVGGNWSGAGTSTVSLYLGLIRTNGNFAYHYDGTSSPVVVMNTTVQDTPYSIQGRMRVGEQYMVINGTKSSVGTISSTFTSSLNMYLFGINNNGLSNPAYMKLYYCKIYDNGNLVRDFIPVLDNNGRPAMYDQVSGQLFYNQGSGEFTYGRQIIPVEYLYTGDDINCMTSSPFTSTSYRLIDTKETIDLTSVVEIKFAFDKNIYYSGCGLRNSTSSTAQSIYFPAAYSTENKIGWTIGSGEEQRQKFTLDTNDHTIRVDLPNSKVVWDDVSYPISNLTYTPSERTFPLFAFSDARATQENGYRFPMQGKIYYAKFWKNGVLTKDFIPCIDENLVPFMFDKVHNTVYLNEGTGQFKAGPNVEKVWGGKKLRRKLALALANLKKKRRYYCEVEYLESTGTQWIDTGVNADIDLGFDVGFKWNIFNTANSRFLGVIKQNGSTYLRHHSSDSGSSFTYFVSNDGTTIQGTATTAFHSFSYNSVTKKFNFDGTEISAVSPAVFDTGLNFWLFGRNSNTESLKSYASVKIYSARLYNNGTLVRDFIPVLDWNMKPCLFDRVTEQLFYNQATSGDDFSYGREIHPVDYLESTGTQYINTGLLSTASSTVDTVFRFTSMESGVANNVGVFGGRNGQQSNTFTLFKIASATPQYFRFDYNGQSTVGTATEMTWNTASKYRFQYNGTSCITTNTTTGESVVLAKSPASTFTQYPIHLFAVNTSGTIGQNLSGRIYYYKYSDGTNSVDMVPAIDENGVAYFFDKVSHTCFLNQGTGAFSYPAREVEYIETDGTSYINTGYTPSGSTETEITTMLKDQTTSRFMFGCRTAQNNNTYACLAHNQNRIGYRVGDSSYLYSSGYNEVNVKHTYKIANGVFYRDDVVIDTSCQGATASPNSPLALLTINTNNTLDTGQSFIGNLYSGTIKENTTLLRDFIPCFKDGQAGMLDKVNNVFYPSSSTAFTAGKIVEPEYE